MQFDTAIYAYAIPLLVIWTAYLGRRKWREHRNKKTLAEAHEARLDAPPSLHPKIDPSRCLACGACVRACPEGNVLGLIHGKAQLISPADCIGHGACRTACPHGAIELVFGTETRGVDIPHVGSDFQTNVPGIYIAGELGGMGLIRNAVEQGRQAVDAIARSNRGQPADCLDLVIVGAGPAGIAASLAAIEHGLSTITLEQESFGGTVAHFPRRKLVMTAPVDFPIVGRMAFREVSKEQLLGFWKHAAEKAGLTVNYGERVEAIIPRGPLFEVRTERGVYPCRAVLLSIGRRGTPRRLDVPGEHLSKVVYRLVDPAQYRGQHVLVVGGGDSALEAATSLAAEPGTTVTLSYRGDGFDRAKPASRNRVMEAWRSGRLNVLLQSQVQSISERAVDIVWSGEIHRLENEAVVVCAGGVLPTDFLKNIGISVETKYGTA